MLWTETVNDWWWFGPGYGLQIAFFGVAE